MAVLFRAAEPIDVPAMARIRASEWGPVDYWETRISGYLDGSLSPRHALATRSCYVAQDGDSIVGFVAGHLTRRYSCDGELQWINVAPDGRRKHIASELLRLLASWFVSQQAIRICVDVEPSNLAARAFYRLHGAEDLNPHWLVWNDIRDIVRSVQR